MSAELTRRNKRIRLMMGVVAERDAHVAQQRDAIDHLASSLLPDVVERLRRGESPLPSGRATGSPTTC
ncbi:hypothetical protein [Streptomyces anthocyanicus]|uniref:hypothetical protein n=1 Tax=Streptomyces anthocyanicus TaxID=68174 RepID=UPI00386514E3|nr:hypothetical protein OH747_40725 [Streptomyces anthocyanicus]